MVWAVCRRVIRDHHDAEDAFQATFLVLACKASSVLPPEKLGNWLYGVANQTAMKARAMRAKRRAREIQVRDMPEPTAARDNVRDDRTELLNRELSLMPQRYRIPLVLCDLQGRTQREAASQLGWPVGTVSSRLSRARAMLVKRLAKRGMSLSVGSLAVLLAQELASASVPTRLVGSTARAASLFAAGVGLTAQVVPAEVAALTGEVFKVMLFRKLKIAMTTLLVATALAAGGTGLAYQVHRTEPSQEEKLKRLIDEKKEELQRLIARQEQRGQPPFEDPRTEFEPPIVITLPDPGNADDYSLDQLRVQKKYVDGLIAVEEARNKTPEQLDVMIQAKTKELERLRRVTGVVEDQIRKLKQYRDAPRTEPGSTRREIQSTGRLSR
jgi:RNA polymerase sigma factor (sigma-70 family)